MIFQKGESTFLGSDYQAVAPSTITQQGTYVFQYQVAPIAFSLLSPSAIQKIIESWLWLKNEQTLEEGGVLVRIDGVYIDDQSGAVRFKAYLSPYKPPTQTVTINGKAVELDGVSSAGINPYAVIAIISGLLIVIGAGAATLLYVYGRVEKSKLGTAIGLGPEGGYNPDGSDPRDIADPCQEAGPVAWFRCQLGRSFWTGIGVMIGVVLVVVVLFVAANRK